MSWSAFVDESMRADPLTGGDYILAAACIDPPDCTAARLTITSLAKDGQRFHWQKSSQEMQRKAVAVVASISAMHIVVVGGRLDGKKQERARRQGLERLLYELRESGVADVFLEARTQSLNLRDIQTINIASAKGIIGKEPRVAHARPLDEPLLWVSDIVAGAINSQLGGDSSLVAPLLGMIERHDIDLT